jgi:hypothetical protein
LETPPLPLGDDVICERPLKADEWKPHESNDCQNNVEIRAINQSIHPTIFNITVSSSRLKNITLTKTKCMYMHTHALSGELNFDN